MFRKGEPAYGGFKLRGEWAELLFMTRGAQHGLRVIKPWGDNSRYDFVVDRRALFARASKMHQLPAT
jgi:hypothetical protein